MILNKRFSFHTINESQIESKIHELKSKKSAGYGNIPPRIIKDCVALIKSPLTNLFNNSIEISHFPDDLNMQIFHPFLRMMNVEVKRIISLLAFSPLFLKCLKD